MPRPPSLKKSFEVQGEWKRWSAYTIRIAQHPYGYQFPTVLRHPKASLSVYDPWEVFRRQEGARLRERQPYLRLLELGRTVRNQREHLSELVRVWCNENGLLGIIPVVADRIPFKPVFLEQEDSEGELLYGAKQLRYIRTGGVWRGEYQFTGYSRDQRSIFDAARDLDLQLPIVHTMGWGREHFRNRSFISAFFPIDGGPLAKRPLDPPVPLPGSPKFFEVYGEPVDAIAYWAEEFESVVLQLNEPQTDERTTELLGYLTELASAAASTFRARRNGRIEEVRVSAGLLASYALMVLWDFQAGRRIVICHNCGKYRVSRDARSGYCSITCRNTAQSRRYRAKKRAKILIEKG